MEDLIKLYLREKIHIAEMIDIEPIAELAEVIEDCWESKGRIFIFANGGPAGTAIHFAADLAQHPFVSEDKKSVNNAAKLRVHCLCNSGPLITGIANDLGFENIFKEQLESYANEFEEMDVVIAFSASGNSKNIVEALKYAKECGAITACISGANNNIARAKDYSNIWIPIPGTSEFPGQTGGNDNCFHIEDFFLSIAHMVTGILKDRVAGEDGYVESE